jgi:hypothetical protein
MELNFPIIVGSHAIRDLPPIRGLYGIMFWPLSRFYVGSSNDIRSRCGDHRSRLRGGAHSNRLLQDAWGRNPEHSFLWMALKAVPDIERLLSEERNQIALLRGFEPYGGFNLEGDPVVGSLADSSRAKLRRRLAEHHPTRGKKLAAALCEKYSASVQSRGALSGAFKGVNLDARTQTYMARLYAKGRQYFLGRYATDVEAAQAYNLAAQEHFGSDCYLNPVPPGSPVRHTRLGRPAGGAHV